MNLTVDRAGSTGPVGRTGGGDHVERQLRGRTTVPNLVICKVGDGGW